MVKRNIMRGSLRSIKGRFNKKAVSFVLIPHTHTHNYALVSKHIYEHFINNKLKPP